MNLITFKKPVPFTELKTDKHCHCSGIYIWGFKLGDLFIPLYVGKHETCILSRIISHVKGLLEQKNYTLFTYTFYANLDQEILYTADPVKVKRSPQPYKDFPSDIKLRFGGEWQGGGTHDEFNEERFIKNTFLNEGSIYITYASTQDLTIQGMNFKKTLTCCETAVKFALKYNTIGRSQSLQLLERQKFDLRITSEDDILQDCFFHYNQSRFNSKINSYSAYTLITHV